MINAVPEKLDNTSVILGVGKGQGYEGIAVRYGYTVDPVCGQPTMCMATAWRPDPDELAALNAGAAILIEQINISRLPPMLVTVMQPPETVNVPDDLEMPKIPGL